MASNVPARFVANVAGDAGRVGVGQIIDKAEELADHIERANFLYAVAGRRVLAERVFTPAQTTTSASFVYFAQWTARISQDRFELGLTSYADDAILEFSVYNASSGAIIGAAATLTHASGGASVASTTLSLPSASVVTEVLVKVGVKKNSSTATLHSFKVLELSLVAASLPS